MTSPLRIARKAHRCAVCCGGIAAGERYQDFKVLPGSELGRDCGFDKPQHMRICGSCLRAEKLCA